MFYSMVEQILRRNWFLRVVHQYQNLKVKGAGFENASAETWARTRQVGHS